MTDQIRSDMKDKCKDALDAIEALKLILQTSIALCEKPGLKFEENWQLKRIVQAANRQGDSVASITRELYLDSLELR